MLDAAVDVHRVDSVGRRQPQEYRGEQQGPEDPLIARAQREHVQRYTDKKVQESKGKGMNSKIVSSIGWSLAIRGVLAIIFGVVAFFYTGQAIVALILVFGVFALLSGLATLIAAVRAGENHKRWGWLALSGVIGIATGLVCFVYPGLTALAFVYIIAAWAILSGSAEIIYALALPRTLEHPWLAALSSALSVLFGIVLTVWPVSGAIALTWVIAIYAIASGATMIYHTFLLRKARSAVRTLANLDNRLAADRR